jgi:hypothetical protein
MVVLTASMVVVLAKSAKIGKNEAEQGDPDKNPEHTIKKA